MNAVGQPISRADGRLKVTGRARYTADIPLVGAAHAAIVHSTIANGRTVSIDISAAEKAPGVLAVFTHRNMPRMNPTPKPWSHLHPHGQGYLPFRTTKSTMRASRSHWWSRRRATRQCMPATLISASSIKPSSQSYSTARQPTRRSILRNSSGRSHRRSATPTKAIARGAVQDRTDLHDVGSPSQSNGAACDRWRSGMRTAR